MNFAPLRKINILLWLGWLALFGAGLTDYSGSKVLYVVFSLSFLALLLSAFHRQLSYGYLFLVLFLWLGFWFKLTSNLLLTGYVSLGEPVGAFDGSPAAWDTVLSVATIAALGCMSGRFIYGLSKPVSTCALDETATPPAWYVAWRTPLGITIFAACLLLAVINSIYGINQIGLTPRTILPWPMNALISWTVSIGSAMAMATILHWEIGLKKKPILPIYAVLIEGFTSTISLLSRAAYLFHSIPPLVVLQRNKEIAWCRTKKGALLFLVVFAVLFMVSLTSVSKLRDYYYNDKTPPPAHAVPNLRPALAHQLFVNRWIGLEGVMAVSAYPHKSMKLFIEMATERRGLGEPTRYQAISNSLYQNASNKYQFATLPGIAAFLFYSGSFTVLMLGMIIFTLGLLAIERLVFALTRNPFMCSLLGLTFANLIAQFGITPRQDIPFVSMTIGATFAIAVLRSRPVERALQKFHGASPV